MIEKIMHLLQIICQWQGTSSHSLLIESKMRLFFAKHLLSQFVFQPTYNQTCHAAAGWAEAAEDPRKETLRLLLHEGLQLGLLISLTEVVARCVHEGEREANAAEDYPKEFEAEEVEETEEEPDEWIAIQCRPENKRVRLTN